MHIIEYKEEHNMPIYEYRCKACGFSFEKLMKSTNQNTPECPKCGASEVIKEMSIFSSAGSSTSTGAGCFSGG